MYRYSEKSVNCVRYKMFEKKQCRENKITDLSTLPPCHQVLQYHIKRSNVITYIWKQSLATNVDYPNKTECRWEVTSLSPGHFKHSCLAVRLIGVSLHQPIRGEGLPSFVMDATAQDTPENTVLLLWTNSKNKIKKMYS